MSTPTTRPDDKQAVRLPAHLRLQRGILALCLLLAPLSLAGWFALCPQYGDPACPNNTQPLAVFAAFRSANPLLLKPFLFFTLIIPYLYPISYVALGLLAMRRAPWLATLGIMSGWMGSIAWGFISDTMLQLNTAVRLGQDTSFSALAIAHFSEPGILAVATGWVLGHLLGYVLLGSALLRARVIPAWAAWLIILSAPLMGPLAYGTKMGLLQVLGFVLVFIGSLPAALAMLSQPGQPESVRAGGPAPMAMS